MGSFHKMVSVADTRLTVENNRVSSVSLLHAFYPADNSFVKHFSEVKLRETRFFRTREKLRTSPP